MQLNVAFAASLALTLTASAYAQSGTARYELTFTSTWSRATHPTDFPPNPHYSPLVGGTHDAATSFWAPGGIATNGIEVMAETGSTTTLVQEVRAAISAGGADQFLVGRGMGSPTSMTFQFSVDANFPRLTLVTMVAPSPDWFVGVHGLNLLPNGEWADNLTVDLRVYDSGTDAGRSYRSPNSNIAPHLPITTVTQSSGPFQGASLVIGSFHFRRLSSELVTGCGINPAGSMAVSGEARIGQSVTMTIDDPTNSMPVPSSTRVLISDSTPGSAPCGVAIPGFGLGPVGSSGELLIGPAFGALVGADWTGSAVPVQLPIPASAGLVGLTFYTQGVVFDTQRVGLTDGVQLVIGM